MNREQHGAGVLAFLQSNFGPTNWHLSLPCGWGRETYIAHGSGMTCFVKLGAPVKIYQAAASLDLSPSLLASGTLPDGTSVLVQEYVRGREPSRRDFQEKLTGFAEMVRRLHHSPELRRLLPPDPSNSFRGLGLRALERLRRKWDRYRDLVPGSAGQVDHELEQIRLWIEDLSGCGCACVHHDICNANWLIGEDGQIYLIDLDSVALDDPAADLGAILWWYYPPPLRPEFIRRAGYLDDAALRERMRVRMAMHCLDILLPRPNSFDRFHPDQFSTSLVDFQAVMAGSENPLGYFD